MRGLLKLVVAVGILATAGLVGGCVGSKEAADPHIAAPAASDVAGQYHCAMHPEVVSPNPGVCPRCKMALTKK